MKKTPRIGIGYDIHRLVEKKPLIIGGVSIPHTKGALGHSDADVLVHALCDAMLGALALGDIGKHFPDTDPKYKGINSLILLKQVHNMIQNQGYELVHLDSVVHLETPKLQPYIPIMRQQIGQTLQLNPELVSIKATTHEQLGAIGQNQGVAAHVVLLLSPLLEGM